MTGPKLNEAPVRRPGQTRRGPAEPLVGAKALARHVPVSSYKVRAVLDLIRGQEAERAREILRFCERDAAIIIDKVVASAVANAENNGSLLADELYVSACFADEGPTLKRWRPRARGRAGRIRKRSCHITVVVSRLPENELQRRRAATGAPTVDRRRRRAGQEAADQRRQAPPPATDEAPPPATDEAPPPATDEAPPAATDQAPPPATDEAEPEEGR